MADPRGITHTLDHHPPSHRFVCSTTTVNGIRSWVWVNKHTHMHTNSPPPPTHTHTHDIMQTKFYNNNLLYKSYVTFSLGQWSDQGLTTVVKKDTVICKSTHLTSFAVLVDISGTTNVSQYINCNTALSYIQCYMHTGMMVL